MGFLEPIDDLDLLRASLLALPAFDTLIRPVLGFGELIVGTFGTVFVPIHLVTVVDREDMIKDIKEGIIVDDTIGAGQGNNMAGDFCLLNRHTEQRQWIRSLCCHQA